MQRRPHRRSSILVATGLTAALVLIATAAPVWAGDTRQVFVGSPGTGGGDGILTFTRVSAGQATKTDIRIANDSASTMNKTTLTIGTFPAAALLNGVTVAGAFGPNGNACAVAAGGASVSCSFGNLRSGQERNVTIVFDVAGPGDPVVEAAVKVKETVNDNGANNDTFFASGAVHIDEFSCDSVATFVVPGQAEIVSTAASTCHSQSTDLSIPALGNGAIVQIDEVTDAECSGTLTCFGSTSKANVNDGAPANLVWSITWNNALLPNGFNVKKAGVLHFEDDGDIVTIANTNAGRCGANPNKTNCIVSFVEGDTTTTVVFRTPSNGGVKGFG